MTTNQDVESKNFKRELTLLCAGGIIAVIGGFIASLTTNHLDVTENERMELNRAYADWGSEFQHVLETEKDRYLFDAYENIKDVKDKNAPRPPLDIVGRNGDEIALENSKSKVLFRASTTRLLFLVIQPKHIEEVKQLSDIEYEDWPDEALEVPRALREVEKLDITKYKKKLLAFNARRTKCLELFQEALQGSKTMNNKERIKSCARPTLVKE